MLPHLAHQICGDVNVDPTVNELAVGSLLR